MVKKWGKTLEEFKKTLKLKEGEILINDLPYCSKCKGARYWTFEDRAGRCICSCESKAYEDEKRREENKKKIEQYYQRLNDSLIGDKYIRANFNKARITDNNKNAYMRCMNYVNHAEEVLKNNLGLYIYGDNSTGKSHLSACISNELVKRGYNCLFTKLSTLLDEIKGTYNNRCESESDILRKMQEYDFVVFDEIGKEFLGRETEPSKFKWAEQKFLEFLTVRYDSNKPTIFNSNYSIRELANILHLDKAITERINEMATRVIKLEGDDFRKGTQQQASEFAKSIGV